MTSNFVVDQSSNETSGTRFLDIMKTEINRKTASLSSDVRVRKAVEQEKLALNRKLNRFNTRQEVS